MNEKVLLWEKEIVPYFNGAFGEFVPDIELWLIDNGKKNNPCVVVIPGGAYACVCDDHEGRQICRFLNDNGYSAVILHYRVHPYCYSAPQTDAARAVRTVRFHAAEWKIDPDKIGVIGFSAGAHLAMCAALDFDYGRTDGDTVDAVSSRPDNAALCYGVLSLDPSIMHMDTRANFLGDNDPALAERYSGENMMRADAPPFFLWHTAADGAVSAQCSLRFASALLRHGQNCALHLFPAGEHGLGLAENAPLANRWGGLYADWLNGVNGLL